MWNPLTALREFFNSSPSKNDSAKRLEQAHKMQFLYLVDATNFYFNLLDSGKAGAALTNYLVKGTVLGTKWLARQKQLESAGAPVYKPIFFSRAARPDINAKAASVRAGIAGTDENLGFAPVVIWALVVAGAWAVERIVDQLTTTTEEQTDLLNETAATCAKLGLSPADCKNVLDQQIQISKSGTDIFGAGGGLIKLALFGFAGYMILNAVSNKKAA